MTLQSFQHLLSKRPFQPLVLVMSSGERYAVRHPEMAMLTRTALYIGIGEEADGIPADAVWVSLLHVAAVEASKNGKLKKRQKSH